MLVNELADQRCRGSHSRAKKLVAALRISIVDSSSRHLRRSSRLNRSDGSPYRRGREMELGIDPDEAIEGMRTFGSARTRWRRSQISPACQKTDVRLAPVRNCGSRFHAGSEEGLKWSDLGLAAAKRPYATLSVESSANAQINASTGVWWREPGYGGVEDGRGAGPHRGRALRTR
jgi:hypothetical protein